MEEYLTEDGMPAVGTTWISPFTEARANDTPVRGSVRIAVVGDRAGAPLAEVTYAFTGYREATGRFSFIGSHSVVLEPQPEESGWVLNDVSEGFSAGSVNETMLRSELVPTFVRRRAEDKLGDQFETANDLYIGAFSATLRPDPGGYHTLSGTLKLTYKRNPGESMMKVRMMERGIDPEEAPIGLIADLQLGFQQPAYVRRKDARIYRRSLHIQPVVVGDTEEALIALSADARPKWIHSADSARYIWGKACITVERNAEPAPVVNPTLHEHPGFICAGDTEGVVMPPIVAAAVNEWAALESDGLPTDGVLPVFLVAADLACAGGGYALNAAHGLACIVLSLQMLSADGTGGNSHLLAHELGHVFGGDHPLSESEIIAGGYAAPIWDGDWFTVLEPDSMMNPAENSVRNCSHAHAFQHALVVDFFQDDCEFTADW